MKRWAWFLAATMICGAASVMMFSGCEEAEGVRAIEVTPANVVLSGATNSAQFTARVSGPLALPLEWRVSDPALGSISGTGSNAVYLRTTRVGNNLVIVRDQYEAEGFAAVTQE